MGDLEFVGISTATEAFTLTDCSFGIKSWDQPMTADIQIAKDRSTQSSSTTIAGISAQKYVYSPNASTVSHAHFLTHNNYHYQISLNHSSSGSSDSCLSLLNQILNTFQFTN